MAMRALLLCWLCVLAGAAAKPLNILMLASDDLRPEIADPYGVVSAHAHATLPQQLDKHFWGAIVQRDCARHRRTSCTRRTSPGWQKLAHPSGSPTARSPSARHLGELEQPPP